MIENRELGLDDYLAMLRRRLKTILIPALVAPLAGFAVSLAFPPRYTSQSAVLVEVQKVPEGYVKPVITEDISQRITTILEQVFTRNRLQPLIDRLGLAKNGQSVDDVIEQMHNNFSYEPVVSGVQTAGAPRHRPGESDIPGFYVNYTAPDPRQAQQICGELTSMIIAENLKSREQVAQSTTDFLSRQLDEAKRALDSQDSKLAAFKTKYMGQLPGDEDNNLKLLMAMNSQLDANTQSLNRAQQDKAYAESLLAQQLATWKSSQNANNPVTLQQQLATLQTELITLQSRYTDDYPDVVKTKNDIAEVKKRLADMNANPAPATDTSDKNAATEPPELRQLRLQIHQYDQAIAQATREQKRLQDQIRSYQGRVALSPGVEEQYKLLTRDYETAQKFYNDLLAKKSESQMQTDLERREQGEQMRLINPANLPDTPSFPNRLLFAAGGLGGGFVVGVALALWGELRDKSIRNEQDVTAALDLPTLISVPWIGSDAGDRSSDGRLHGRTKPPAEEKPETVEV
ncbi:MAG: lipopolysaccharide biosynthesis protein [Acidobacteriales bacterium]|nr:lipopolysaccharide biosynthesis protein [Terriglobales bacterium]